MQRNNYFHFFNATGTQITTDDSQKNVRLSHVLLFLYSQPLIDPSSGRGAELSSIHCQSSGRFLHCTFKEDNSKSPLATTTLAPTDNTEKNEQRKPLGPV